MDDKLELELKTVLYNLWFAIVDRNLDDFMDTDEEEELLTKAFELSTGTRLGEDRQGDYSHIVLYDWQK